MIIQKHKLDAILKDLHADIDETSDKVVSELETTDIIYPPNIELNEKEKHALSKLNLSDDAKSGLKKLISNAACVPIFHFFNKLDGTGDPETDIGEMWYGVYLVEKHPDRDDDGYNMMLHDEFFETSWLYKDWTKVD